MSINFNTNNIIIVTYPRNAGGKFLINCLGLSDDAVFSNAELAENQINGKFTIDDKMQYLMNELDNVHDSWTDLNLFCYDLFGKEAISRSQSQPLEEIKFLPIIEKLSNNNLKFFLVAHDIMSLKIDTMTWKNSKIIQFKNYKKFIDFREKNRKSNFNDIVLKKLPFKDAHHYKNIKLTNQIFFWDTDLYFSCDATVNRIEQLYDELGLTNFNRKYIVKYYNRWINKLKELT